MLIIGCGNRQRGDDAAGILVAERLCTLGIEAETCTGEAADLLEAWDGADDVIVVDAVVTGAPVGAVQVWDCQQATLSPKTTASSHSLGVAEAIALARVLHRLPARLRLFGIEGRRFDQAAEVSPEVLRAVDDVVRSIAAELPAGLKSPRE